MANTFKLKTLDGSAIAANTASTVYTSPAATTTIVLGLTLANITSATIFVTVLIDNADGDNVNFLKGVPIPTGSAIEVMAGNKINLETGDLIKVKSATANSLDTCLSIMEQT
jgi:hypothetical protein|tara:strand:+ start:598 stop:933 length:336 start_codon:yes stop_codon:yes gene_type:complete